MSRAAAALEARQAHVLRQVWRANGDSVEFDPATVVTPLSKVLDAEAAVRSLEGLDQETREMIGEQLGMEIDDLVLGVRNDAMQVLFDFIFGGSILPREVLKRLFGFVRVFSPTHSWNMSQTQLAALLGETKGATNAREKREVEQFYRLWTLKTWQPAGGKSATARERYSKDRKGNHCRKGGKKMQRLFRGEEEVTAPDRVVDDDDFPRRRDISPRLLAEMAEEHERKRVAKLCGVKPSQIDLKRARPLGDHERVEIKKPTTNKKKKP